MFGFFKKKKTQTSAYSLADLTTDMHSHLLPNIDDGAKDINHAVALVKSLKEIGYKKLITTPHVMHDFYKNTPEIISEKLQLLREKLTQENISIPIEAAAEYYLDEFFVQKLKKQEPLLSFGKKKYVLFETAFMNASSYLHEAIFQMQLAGYQPVFAHPERYVYLFGKYEEILSLKEKGVYLQINLNSLTGYYSKESKKIAERLIEDKAVDFVGTDCHNEKHIDNLLLAPQSKYFDKLLSLPLLNATLL
ncbi:MAG: capsular biosynthesis protein [Flammeovirgaceae bacterium]|nr:capsular biosynthesis protein [Flammeovirgaceae bacterium]MDW8288449.1 CpsB/CapC family capsule biosynthesis tyrosine phosphatase [Flammeovirgaceae bacterium]